MKGIIFILCIFLFVACQSEDTVNFSDQQLEIAIRHEIEEVEGEIKQSDLDNIKELDLVGLGITNIAGIESFHSLQALAIGNNEIRDFSLLEELENLEYVSVYGNPFEDDEDQLAVFARLAEQGIQVDKLEVVGRPDGPGGLLWKVVNEDTVVYLQGTIHVGIDSFYPLHEHIERAYAESDVVVPEIDLTSVDPVALERLNMELGTYQDGTTVEEHLPKDLYDRLADAYAQYGIPMEALNHFKPWILANTLQQLMMQQLGYIHGVDEYFLDRAVRDQKEIVDLETVEDQLHLLANSSLEYQIQSLEESLVDIDEFDTQMRELFDFYMEGDEQQLLYASAGDDPGNLSEEEQEFLKLLNDERNIKMTDKIIDFLEEDNDTTYFVIVGSLHLIMEPHIVSLLEEYGFVVERIH